MLDVVTLGFASPADMAPFHLIVNKNLPADIAAGSRIRLNPRPVVSTVAPKLPTGVVCISPKTFVD